MLSDFTINYRGVTITPQLKKYDSHEVLEYRYNNIKIAILYDSNIYHKLFYKSDYVTWVKDLAVYKLGAVQ